MGNHFPEVALKLRAQVPPRSPTPRKSAGRASQYDAFVLSSDHDPLHLIQGNLIAGAVVEPGSLGGLMGGDGSGFSRVPPVLK